MPPLLQARTSRIACGERFGYVATSVTRAWSSVNQLPSGDRHPFQAAAGAPLILQTLVKAAHQAGIDEPNGQVGRGTRFVLRFGI